MMSSPYTFVAAVVTLSVYFLLPHDKLRSLTGSVIVGLIWPVLLPMALYFGVKIWLLRYPMAKAWVLDLEILGCVVVTGFGFAWVLVHRGLLALQ